MAEQIVDQESPINSETRIELLERNLRYMQAQHETILTDLHQEINRLQQENQNLHYQLMNSTKPEETSLPSSDLQNRIDELEKRLYQTEEKNQLLTKKVTELNQVLSSKSDNRSDSDERSTVDQEYQQLYRQEITKLRSIILEILNRERLSSSSRALLRDCLTSSNLSELSMYKNTTTPIDILYTTDNPRLTPPLTGKTVSYRSELPIRRLNLSPPRIVERRSAQLPAIHSALSQHSAVRIASSMSPVNYSQYQCIVKVGETPVARRGKRTQEIQKNRLTKNLYH